MRHSFSVSIRPAFIATAMVVPIVVLGAFCLAQPRQSAKPPTAKQKYKNILVLKDLPADQLIPLMHKVNTSLGVTCDFCHVRTGYEKDDKPEKKAARQMIVMTGGLNKQYKIVDRKVTCFTCHHGHAMPESAPPGA